MQPEIHHITTLAGHSIATYIWPLPDKPKAVVYLSHSFGSYHTRFTGLAKLLIQQGYAVCGHDMYGHGQSGGRRADVPDFQTPIMDLSTVMDFCRTQHPALSSVPVAAFSFGTGSIANAVVAVQQIQHVDALVIVSPYLKPYKTRLQKFLSTAIPLRHFGFIKVSTNVHPKKLILNPVQRKAYMNDPLTHKTIYARSYLYMRDGAKLLFKLAAKWNTPTLVMYTQDDPVVDPKETQAFISTLPADLISTHVMQNQSHIFFQELDRDKYFLHITNWLDTYFA